MTYGQCFAENQAKFKDLMTNTQAIAEKTFAIISEYLSKTNHHSLQSNVANLSTMFELYSTFLKNALSDPASFFAKQMDYYNDAMNLWQKYTIGTELFNRTEDSSPIKDKRFADAKWDELPIFAFIKHAYLLFAKHIQTLVAQLHHDDEDTRKKIEFYTRQFINALSPSNYIFTNPEVLKQTIETQGENLVKGLSNMLNDIQNSTTGFLNIAMTDMNAFEVGKNVGVTKGKIVFQNELHQLIQYTPTTKQVNAKPILIVPPWINKFYILDLQPENSLVKYLVDNGHTVFMISWVNPDIRHAQKSFSDYMLEGSLTAIKVAQEITGEKKINTVGYCLGGTLLAASLAFLSKKKYDVVESATFLATLIDFSDPGEIGVFIDEAQIAELEKRMAQQGYLDGAYMSLSFNMLRSNELIWSYYVHNYLLGQEPFPFDLLYWNCDNTNLPLAMHSFYLRKMYLENAFCKKNALSLADTEIDVSHIKTPCFFVSAQEDHIALWRSTYLGAKLPAGKVEFVLSGSGHIAGIVNPASKKKYGYWTNKKIEENADEWFNNAKQHEGSWWPHWNQWLASYSGEQVAARKEGSTKYKPLEDAPGSFVKKSARNS